jgi:hypothetical protein
LVRIGPTAWPFTGFIHTDIHTDRQLDKYILDKHMLCIVPAGESPITIDRAKGPRLTHKH